MPNHPDLDALEHAAATLQAKAHRTTSAELMGAAETVASMLPALLAELRAAREGRETDSAVRKLAAVLLDKAADTFSNHGCNDFDLVEDAKLTPAESFAIRKAAREWNGDADDNPERADEHGMSDWWAMAYCAHALAPSPRDGEDSAR